MFLWSSLQSIRTLSTSVFCDELGLFLFVMWQFNTVVLTHARFIWSNAHICAPSQNQTENMERMKPVPAWCCCCEDSEGHEDMVSPGQSGTAWASCTEPDINTTHDELELHLMLLLQCHSDQCWYPLYTVHRLNMDVIFSRKWAYAVGWAYMAQWICFYSWYLFWRTLNSYYHIS